MAGWNTDGDWFGAKIVAKMRIYRFSFFVGEERIG